MRFCSQRAWTVRYKELDEAYKWFLDTTKRRGPIPIQTTRG